MNDTFCVYMHENKINRKKYIGITKLIPENRWRNGLGYHSQSKFYRAIQKYGWNNFEHFILCNCLNECDAKTLEKFFIKKFDSCENGYNCTLGGDGQFGNKVWLGRKHSDSTKEKMRNTLPSRRKVIQYTLDFEYIKTYDSISDASRKTGIKLSNIQKVCANNTNIKKAGGYIWRYE